LKTGIFKDYFRPIDARTAIAELYPELKQVASRICKGKEYHVDLLHTSCELVMRKEPNITELNQWKAYLITTIYQQAHGRARDPFGKERLAWNANRVEFNPQIHHRPEAWLGARLDNEVIDMAIQRIPDDVDRYVFQLYALGISSKEIAEATGIKAPDLHQAVTRAKKFLRKILIKL